LKQEEALQAILAEWRRRPAAERQTETQLAAFALEMANNPDYLFRCSGDRYQLVIGYLSLHTSGLKKQGL
jgi:hypothetical protein